MVRLYGCDGQAGRALKQTLETLSLGPVVLHAVPGIVAIGGCHVSAVLAKRSRGLLRIGPTSFLWEENDVGWEQVCPMGLPTGDDVHRWPVPRRWPPALGLVRGGMLQ